MYLYHGSREKDLEPSFDIGRADNDFGSGFYTTPDKELAKEWAWSGGLDCESVYVYSYVLDYPGLKILDLTKLDAVHWVAELLSNRRLNIDNRHGLEDTLKRFLSLYKLDTSGYDVIIGYRADDCCFAYVLDFLYGINYWSDLQSAFDAREFGLQIVLKSNLALLHLFDIERETVPKKYAYDYMKRNSETVIKYNHAAQEKPLPNDKLICDFIR